jgi:hypothetical protein
VGDRGLALIHASFDALIKSDARLVGIWGGEAMPAGGTTPAMGQR